MHRAQHRHPGGTEVVQLYLSDPVATVVRPVRWLAGFTRVPLAPGEASRVAFRLHADRTSFTGRAGSRIVEPGEIGVAVGGASDCLPLTGSFTLPGRSGWWAPTGSSILPWRCTTFPAEPT